MEQLQTIVNESIIEKLSTEDLRYYNKKLIFEKLVNPKGSIKYKINVIFDWSSV